MQTSAGDDEGEHQARAGLLRAGGGQHENAGADDAADAEQGQLERAQRAVQRLLFGGRENGVEWLDAP